MLFLNDSASVSAEISNHSLISCSDPAYHFSFQSLQSTFHDLQCTFHVVQCTLQVVKDKHIVGYFRNTLIQNFKKSDKYLVDFEKNDYLC